MNITTKEKTTFAAGGFYTKGSAQAANAAYTLDVEEGRTPFARPVSADKTTLQLNNEYRLAQQTS